jgi:hypothetical protein
MKTELTLIEVLQIEIECEEARYKYALVANKPIEQIQMIQKRIEYLKVTLETIQERYNTDKKIEG